jgi:Fusaric acid resistance protein-like
LDCGVLSAACLLAYWLVTGPRSHVYSLSKADDVVGGLWALIATVFVYRDSYERSVSAAVSRLEATLVSFALCLIYLIFLPFQPWALAVLIGASTLTVTLLGRPEEVITAGISTAVVTVSAALATAVPPSGRHHHRRRRRHRGRLGRLARAPPQTQEPR